MGGFLSSVVAPCCAAIGHRGYSRPLFSMGLVADVQAGQKPDAESEGRLQRFSTAVIRLSEAVAYWLGYGVDRVLSLGDLVDGRNDEESSHDDLQLVLAQFARLACPVHHVVGNHCMKFVPRQRLLAILKLKSSYYSVDLASGWRLIVLDTTELSTHAGWPVGSPQEAEANAYLNAHRNQIRMKRWNGGTGEVQTNWFRSELARAEAEGVRVIVASHHALAPGSCRETHRAWNGDELAAACAASPAFVVALAGHDHPGGFVVHRGRPFVTVEALLEAKGDGNAFAVMRVYEDRVVIDGVGTGVTSRLISIPVQGEPLYCATFSSTRRGPRS